VAWHVAANAGDVAEDGVIGVAVQGHEIALYRVGGQYYATQNLCTHEEAYLSEGYVADGCIECPLHQATFEIRTGRVLREPAEHDLRTYPVKVQGEDLWVDI
jgi:nitrite reductase/ring-hydroxylating ferredoxin subunit